MVERLRLRIVLHGREPAHSLAARLAARHGENIPSFVKALGLDLRQLAQGRGISRLANLSSTDADLLTANTASSTGVGQSIKLCDEYLSWLDWSISPRRVCPACLFDDRAGSCSSSVTWVAWHRAWWDVRCIQVCPVHACFLTSQCSECGEQLDWHTSAIDHCSNGHLLARRPVERRLDAMADRYLYQRFYRAKAGATNQFLDQLTIGNAAKVIDRLGAVAELPWSTQLPATSDGHLAAHRRSLGFCMSLDLENRFRSALDRGIAQMPTGKRGLIENYGWIYRSWLRVPDADHSGGRLRSILRTHAADHGIIAAPEQFPSKRTLSLQAASATIGKSRAYTRRFLLSEGLVPRGSRHGVAFQMEPEDVDRIRIHVSTLIDSATSAKLLGIGRGQFRLLVADSLVVVDEKANRSGCGRFFAPADLLNFCTRLASDAPIASSPHMPAESLPTACRAAGVTISKVCRAILDGEIVPLSRNPNKSGIAAIMLSPRDLQVLRKPRYRPVAAVAEALDIHLQAASELIKEGGFGDPPDVSVSSLASFKRHFVMPNDLADLLGGSGRSVIRQLRAANLEPAFGPPKCRQLFYPRHEASNILARSKSKNGYDV